MLRRLQLENFKAWKKADMRLAPLTGLFGTNSSGKTSILQFLLMLKQTVESSDRALVLNLNGHYVELGTFRDILLDNNVDNKLLFKLEYAYKIEDGHFPEFGDSHFSNHIGSFDSQISQQDNSPIIEHSYFLFEGGIKYGISLIENDKYVFESNETKPFTLKRRESFSFCRFPKPLGFQFNSLEESHEDYFFKLFTSIYYLGPLREYPKRNYTWGGERRSQLGNRGEFAIECILASRERGDEIEHEGKTYSLETYLAMWLRKLGMIQDFKIDSITEGGRLFEVRVRQTEKSPYVLLTDVGFGVSQILPVLTLCYYTPKGSILLMEQPEIHLHPRVQAGLADVFIDAIQKRGVQIILESHSEHLLRRLQLRIAQEKFSSDDAALYFCEIKEGYSELRDLQLDEFGNIKNWPDNFFGDEMTEVFQMSEAIAERKKKAKMNGK